MPSSINKFSLIIRLGIVLILLGIFLSLFIWKLVAVTELDGEDQEVQEGDSRYFYGLVEDIGNGYFTIKGIDREFQFDQLNMDAPDEDGHYLVKARGKGHTLDVVEMHRVDLINYSFYGLIVIGIIATAYPLFSSQQQLIELLDIRAEVERELALLKGQPKEAELSSSDRMKIERLYDKVELMDKDRAFFESPRYIAELKRLRETASQLKTVIHVHGDLVEGSKSEIVNSVISRSSIGDDRPSNGTGDLASQLKELAELREEGHLSEEEFIAAKERLLAKD